MKIKQKSITWSDSSEFYCNSVDLGKYCYTIQGTLKKLYLFHLKKKPEINSLKPQNQLLMSLIFDRFEIEDLFWYLSNTVSKFCSPTLNKFKQIN